MEEYVNIVFIHDTMRRDLYAIRSQLSAIAEKEATYLYRLAWRMKAHGCKEESIRECREEANILHMCSYPERLISGEMRWKYAFKI